MSKRAREARRKIFPIIQEEYISGKELMIYCNTQLQELRYYVLRQHFNYVPSVEL